VYDEGAPFEYYTEKDAKECIGCAVKILSWVKGEIR
jgi:HEPN domain-containing protein